MENHLFSWQKRLHNYGKIDHAINGKTSAFSMAMFNSKLLVIKKKVCSVAILVLT